nr:polycystic kidney disease protein 1-like 2 [Leptinotarsa decemlineata]
MEIILRKSMDILNFIFIIDVLLMVPIEYASAESEQTDWRKMSQIIESRKRTKPVLSWRCWSNCPPLSPIVDIEKDMVLEAYCKLNCEQIQTNQTFRWSVEVPDFDYDKFTLGRDQGKFTIKKNAFQTGKTYTVGFSLLGEKGKIRAMFPTHIGPKLGECSVNPPRGYASRTQFHVKCNHKPGNVTYKLYSVSNQSEFLLATGTSLEAMPIMLNEDVAVKVKIIDEYKFTDEKQMSVIVFASLKNVHTSKELVNDIEVKYFDAKKDRSVIGLMKSNRTDDLLQMLNVLTEEMAKLAKNNETEVTMKEYHKRILDILKNIPLESREVAKQVAVISSKIATQYEQKSDPDIAEATSEVCQFASDKYLDHIEDESYINMLSSDIEKAVHMFAGCSRAISGINLEILEPQAFIDEPTTPFPLVDFPVITENYPDYIDDENISKILTKYETASENLVYQCYINSKTVAISMINWEGTRFVTTDNYEITATKKWGSEIPYILISSRSVDLLASEDFVEYEESDVYVLLCTMTKNPYWWILKERIPTTIAMLTFALEEKVISNFVEPFSISFKNNANKSVLLLHTSRTPSKANSSLASEIYDFERITMFRIDVFRKQGYIIEFEELTANDSFKVHVSDFMKPTPKEFQNKSKLITQDNNILFIPHDNDFDVWHYLCVLPASENQQNLEFKFRVYTMSCYQWVASVRNWEFACGSDETSTFERFECLCYHSSVLCGRIKNNNIREEKTRILMNELELQTTVIIFISVAVAFFLYCVLLIYVTLTTKKISEKSIYFLSDIPSSYRFGYLIIVKTGNKSDAGTTSNVIIKLYGLSAESKEHVLNFPDPEKRILQQNQEDWFFLATEFYLGDIDRIEIWFDSLGFRPSWYCSEIEVVDLQMNKYWWFNIKFRFEICDKENYYFSATPERQSVRKTNPRFFLNKISLHGCHMWNIFRDDEDAISRTKRLTMMLSIFMTTYTVIMFLYDIPKLQNSDSLGQYSEYGFNVQLLWTTCWGFAITVLIHMPIVHFFRFHHEEIAAESRTGLVGKYLPHLNLICWCSLILIVIACMTTLIIMGFWVPHVTALLWLTSTIVSLLIYICILENCVRIVYNFILNRARRLIHILRRIKPALAYIEGQRSLVYTKFGQISLRPYYRHLYKPMGPSRIKEQKHWALVKESIIEIVEDLVMITVYVLLLYTVILKDRDAMSYLSNKEAEDLVIGRHSRTMPKKHAISNRKEIEEYITNTVVFSMQSLQWYGRYVTKEPGMTIDQNNKYIGIARLRQLRSNNISCIVVPPMEFLTNSCIHQFSNGPEYRDFSEGWGYDSNSDEFARMDSVWNYNSYYATGSLSYIGKFATYPGGGYVSTLGRTMKNSLINTNYIFRNNWLDKFTRCIFVEFLLYNSNSNLFQSVLVSFEISAIGFVEPNFNIKSARLLFVKEKTGLLVTILLFGFLTMVFILTVKLVLKIIRKKKMLFKDLWHVVDIVIITISIACLFLYMERAMLVKSFLVKIENAKHNEFVNYFHLFFAESALTILAAILVFIATLRLWKLLRFLQIIKIAEKTFALSLGAIVLIFFYHMLTVFAFTLSGIMFFGDHSSDFKNILDSTTTLILMSLSFFQDFKFMTLKTPLHHLYYSLYMLISLFYLTLYIAIITICYTEAQVIYSREEGYDVFDFLKEQYQYYKGVAKVKLRSSRIRGGESGSEGRKWIYPKADVHRYANCLTVPKNRTSGMVHVTLAILRNMKRTPTLKQGAESLIKMIIANFFRKDSQENDFFFISHAKRGKATIVDDLVFLKMEKVLTVLFSKANRQKESFYAGLLESNQRRVDVMTENLSVLMNTLARIDFEFEE